MPVIYDTNLKNARMLATRDEVAGGTLELLAAGGAVLAAFTLSATGGTVANSVWTLTFEDTAGEGSAAAGTGTNVVAARIQDALDATRVTGLTVDLSEADIIVDNTNIAEGQAVTLVGAQTIGHAPDPQ